MKFFISQPMSDIPESEVLDTLTGIEFLLKYIYKEKVEIVNTYYDEEAKDADSHKHPKLYRIGHALMKLADCDYIVFADGWETKRGCRMERIAAEIYGIPHITVNELLDILTKYDKGFLKDGKEEKRCKND